MAVGPIPFIDLKRLVAEIRNDVIADWTACLDNAEFVGGPRVGAVEKKLATALGVPHVVSCANGTDALLVALQTLGVKRGMKVALPNLTFWATFEAVAQLGAVPVLVDIDPDDLHVDLDQLKAAHDAHRFDALMLVHLFGWTSSRLAEIRAFCKERDVAIVEDGAQCFGVQVAGKPVLAEAAVATLSFYPAKVVGGAMDGGAVTVQSKEHEAFLRSICNHGRSDHYSYAHVGWNSRMGGLQAAFLSRMLDKLPAILESRRATAAWYRERLAPVKGVRVFGPPSGVVENGYLSVLTVEGKRGQEVVDALKAAGVGAARTYPETMDVQPPAKSAGAIAHGDLRHSKAFCEKVVNLPLFYG
ncbi:MAG: Pleiotropic regulatory protein, partial [Labilithrix sp.]|nr:Pleiotropic regulatory protein [Labilithrix sp.]